MHRPPHRVSPPGRAARTLRALRAATLLGCLALAAAPPAGAVRQGAPPPAPSDEPSALAGVEWLVGDWQGAVGDDRVDEVWLPPVGGAMAGLFRWSKEDRVYLYELMTLEATGGGVVLKIKHFGPDLIGWEDKAASVVFDLVESADGRAVFEKRRGGDAARLVYRRTEEGAMTVTLEEAGGQPLSFRYLRR